MTWIVLDGLNILNILELNCQTNLMIIELLAKYLYIIFIDVSESFTQQSSNYDWNFYYRALKSPFKTQRKLVVKGTMAGQENSWRHGRMSPGKKSMKMRNHNADNHKFASFLIITYIYRLIFWDYLTFEATQKLK